MYRDRGKARRISAHLSLPLTRCLLGLTRTGQTGQMSGSKLGFYQQSQRVSPVEPTASVGFYHMAEDRSAPVAAAGRVQPLLPLASAVNASPVISLTSRVPLTG